MKIHNNNKNNNNYIKLLDTKLKSPVLETIIDYEIMIKTRNFENKKLFFFYI